MNVSALSSDGLRSKASQQACRVLNSEEGGSVDSRVRWRFFGRSSLWSALSAMSGQSPGFLLRASRVAINPITQSKLFDLIELNSNRSNRSEAYNNSIKSDELNDSDDHVYVQ
jgi:hypothetical protein